MKIYINTKNKDYIEVILMAENKPIAKLYQNNKHGSQALLPLITKIIKANGISFKDIKAVQVETGPGSFTGLRVGVSVANAIGYVLNIPVNGKKIETELTY